MHKLALIGILIVGLMQIPLSYGEGACDFSGENLDDVTRNFEGFEVELKSKQIDYELGEDDYLSSLYLDPKVIEDIGTVIVSVDFVICNNEESKNVINSYDLIHDYDKSWELLEDVPIPNAGNQILNYYVFVVNVRDAETFNVYYDYDDWDISEIVPVEKKDQTLEIGETSKGISIIEFIAYGFVCYFSIAVLIWLGSGNKFPLKIDNSSMRFVFFIPGIIAALYLGGMGEEITHYEITTAKTELEIYNYSKIGGENQSTIGNITKTTETNERVVTNLVDPAILWFHYLLAIVMIIWTLYQIFLIFGYWKKS